MNILTSFGTFSKINSYAWQDVTKIRPPHSPAVEMTTGALFMHTFKLMLGEARIFCTFQLWSEDLGGTQRPPWKNLLI